MKRARLNVALPCALAMLAAAPAQAEGVPPAIGRISHAVAPDPGAAVCTGVLVAPDLVLTAAHCVHAAVESPGTLQFSAGWSGGAPRDAAGLRKAARIILLPDKDPQGLERLLQDVALVVLEAPLPTDAFPPLDAAAPDGGPFTLIGFDRGTPDRLPEPVTCMPLLTPPGLLALDCPVVSGNSGAPLLRWDGTGWRVVAVLVASARQGAIRSWAVLPPAPFRLRIDEAAD